MHLFLNRERKIRNGWWVVIFFLLLSCFLFPLIILADRYSFEITMVQQALMILIVTMLCQWLRRKPLSEVTGRFDLTGLKQFLLGGLLGALLMIIPVLLLTIGGFISWQVNTLAYAGILTGISTMFCIALAEELLFRGFIFQRLIQGLGNWPAQLIIACLFLLTHVNNPGLTGITKLLAFLNIFIASMMFGLAYIKTKGLAMPVGLHFMANFMQGPVLGFGVSGDKDHGLMSGTFANTPVWLSGGDFGIEGSILGLCFVVLLTAYLYSWQPVKSEPGTRSL